jgi:hypothetical protein
MRIVVETCPFSNIATVIKTLDDVLWQQFIPQQQSELHLVAHFQIIGECPAMLPKTPYAELFFFHLEISSLIGFGLWIRDGFSFCRKTYSPHQ